MLSLRLLCIGRNSPVACVIFITLLASAGAGCTDVDDLIAPIGDVEDGNGADGNALDTASTDTDSSANDGAGSDATACIADSGCDDGDPCTQDRCADGACSHSALTSSVGNPAPCDDGNPCTTGDHCDANGNCAAGLAKGCDDGQPCTADSCNPTTGACVNTAQDAVPCNDGSACTKGDACAQGGCNGAPVLCDDGNPCTVDGCDVKTGCSHEPLTAGTGKPAACDDGSACTSGDACAAGVCVGVAAGSAGGPTCDDGDPCTKDGCDADKGCTHAPLADGTPCDDGLPCSKGDACTAGACKAKELGGCGCKLDSDCADDGDLCNGVPTCDTSGAVGVCKAPVGGGVVCKDGGPCAVSACDPAKGTCSTTLKPDNTPCDADGDLCTVGDACSGGVCAIGKAADCDDNNPCTDESCSPKVGCVSTPNGAPCDADGTACTQGDACKQGVCLAGTLKACFDGNPCTLDSCDPKSGACVADAKGADGLICDADGSACTVADVCSDGSCKPGTALACDDNNPCTSDGCHPIDGCTKSANAASCEDGNLCTVGDSCTGGACKGGALKPCDDGNKCTIDSCDANNGLCVHDKLAGCSKPCGADADCKDDNPCTTESCDSGVCATKPLEATCDDGNACTVGDVCKQGVCAPGLAKSCNDGNPCTDDVCNPISGCLHPANSAGCDADADPCTAADVCKDKACILGPKKACDDGSPCTKDSCDAKTGSCLHDAKPFEGDPCDADGSVCTVSDSCAGGVCTKGKALPCDDSNPCTVDACDPKAGCSHTAKAGACEDGDACTLNDNCQGTTCKAGSAKVCDDGDACTQDGCDAKTGACTKTPVVGCAGTCASAADCDDGKPCTSDGCDKGLCTHQNLTATCASVDACAKAGTCQAGSCVGGSFTNCDDGKPCTTDACNSKTGECSWTTNTAPCDDGNPCTEGDACKLGSCTAGSPKVCNDNNPCTTDACDVKTGNCVTQNVDGAACDDNDACTSGEVCSGGACKPSGKATLIGTLGDGKAGKLDGPADKATFDGPWGAGRGPGTTLLVAELGNHKIRQILPTGEVKTFAGTGKAGFLDGPALQAQFYAPSGIDRDAEGNVYVADMFNHRIRKIDVNGKVSTFAGDGKAGWKDGFGSVALFDLPVGLAVDAAGVYVSEQTNHTIRLCTWDGMVVTVAGQPKKAGMADGDASKSLLSSPYGLAVGPGGGLYIADSGNHRVRFLTASGLVLTAAGLDKGFVDGPIQVARLDTPMDVAVLPGGDVLVADRNNNRIRRLGFDGTLTTIYGDGSATKVSQAFGVAADYAGNAAFVSFDSHVVVRLRLAKVVCDDGNDCSTDSCDPKTGSCSAKLVADGTSCGDGCATKQACKSGSCGIGFPKDCDDNDPCTSDYCTASVCKHVQVPGCK